LLLSKSFAFHTWLLAADATDDDGKEIVWFSVYGWKFIMHAYSLAF
jgi:hypothetical protein